MAEGKLMEIYTWILSANHIECPTCGKRFLVSANKYSIFKYCPECGRYMKLSCYKEQHDPVEQFGGVRCGNCSCWERYIVAGDPKLKSFGTCNKFKQKPQCHTFCTSEDDFCKFGEKE